MIIQCILKRFLLFTLFFLFLIASRLPGTENFSVKSEIFQDFENFSLLIHELAEEKLEGFSGGDGSEDNPYLVASPGQLNNIRNYIGEDNSGVYFLQIDNIDLNVPPYNQGKGWEPIGGVISGQEFFGNYDGNGFKIKNLYINRPDENYIGLFSITRNATLKNIALTDVNITGNIRVAGLAGETRSSGDENHSLVTHSYVTGKASGDQFVSGLVAHNISRGGTAEISFCWANVDLTGTGYKTAGLIGHNESIAGSAIVTHSFATGNVFSNSVWVGGLVGVNQSNKGLALITHSYATGNVQGTGQVGGLVGRNLSDGGISVVTQSYSVGVVVGSSQVGGLVGLNQNIGHEAIVEYSFWDNTSSQIDEGIGLNNGTIVQVNPIQSLKPLEKGFAFYRQTYQSENSNWDFDENSGEWLIEEGFSYPWLRQNPQELAPGFTIPGSVEILSPEPDQVQVSPTAKFIWKPAVRAESYELEITAYGIAENPDYNSSYIYGTTYTLTKSLIPETAYNWRIRAINKMGNGEWSSSFSFTTGIELPDVITLHQNYPNPFNPNTIISFDLPNPMHVRLNIIDLNGRLIYTLLDEEVSEGRQFVDFNASNFSSGLYFYRLQAEGKSITKIMTLIR